MSLTIDQLFLQTRRALQDAGIDSAAIDAKVMMLEVLDWDWSALIAKGQCEADTQTIRQIELFRQRRIDGEPLAYIVGYREFFGHRFFVNPSTLIPRPDSEVIVESALKSLEALRYRQNARGNGSDKFAILDLGTGSGALLLSILCQAPDTHGVGIDVTVNALHTAKRSAQALGAANRVLFACGNWADSIRENVEQGRRVDKMSDLGGFGGFDVIVSNPPYIATAEIENLARGITEYEPRRALDGGCDGLLCYRALVAVFREKLRPGGYFIVEHGYDQQKKVADILFDNAELIFCEDLSDLAGRPRGLVGQRNFSRD